MVVTRRTGVVLVTSCGFRRVDILHLYFAQRACVASLPETRSDSRSRTWLGIWGRHHSGRRILGIIYIGLLNGHGWILHTWIHCKRCLLRHRANVRIRRHG